MEISVRAPSALEVQDVKYHPEEKELCTTPIFYEKNGLATAAVLAIRINGKIQKLYALKISGRTGKLTLVDNSEPVVSAFETELEEDDG